MRAQLAPAMQLDRGRIVPSAGHVTRHARVLLRARSVQAPSTDLRVVRDPGDLSGRRICFFVSYAPDYLLKQHVRFHLAALQQAGFDVVYIGIVDTFSPRSVSRETAGLAGVVIRRNAGFDFGAWADAFRLFPSAWRAECILLVNDSVFGPVFDLRDLMRRINDMPADLVGLTESYEVRRHFQSYFLLFRRQALRHPLAQLYWQGVQNLDGKWRVTLAYETGLLRAYQRFGITNDVAFPWRPVPGARGGNPTHAQWRELLTRGFPYIKAELLRDNPVGVDIADWRDFVASPALLAAIEADLAARSGRPARTG